MVRKEPSSLGMPFLGLGSQLFHSFSRENKNEAPGIDLFLEIGRNKFCKSLHLGLLAPAQPWPSGSGLAAVAHTQPCKLISSITRQFFSHATPRGFSRVLPNQNVNYICLSVAVSTGERPSLFGVCVSQKCDHPLHNNLTIAPYARPICTPGGTRGSDRYHANLLQGSVYTRH